MKSGALIFFIAVWAVAARAQDLPKPFAGKLERIEKFHSEFVDARNVDVWLPENYPSAGKYAVLYMHDGQMLFDSTVTWNHQAWDVDDIATGLMRENIIRNVIVVGVWNGGKTRHSDYFPQKPYEAMSVEQQQKIFQARRESGYPVFNNYPVRSDNYLRFLVFELKPYIDSHYSTNTGPDNTFIAGSSMGGLISLYAICEYPQVFGGAACISTHWPGIFTTEYNPFPGSLFKYLRTHLPDPLTHKIYFDHGDQTTDAMYPPLQKKVDKIMKSKGYTPASWKTCFFPGKDHSEKAWKERLDVPLIFLLGDRGE